MYKYSVCFWATVIIQQVCAPGEGALTCIGGTGMCRSDDPLFQTQMSVL